MISDKTDEALSVFNERIVQLHDKLEKHSLDEIYKVQDVVSKSIET